MTTRQPTLKARTAAELMHANPMSLRETATVAEAVCFLADKGFSAAPVIDERGRPVGVVSRADIIIFDRQNYKNEGMPAYYDDMDLAVPENRPLRSVRRAEEVRVRDIMTPVVFSVGADAPAYEVVNEMASMKVHRIFVVDDSGTLVGIISSIDVLKNMVS
jgi:CBS-domain-containing membrane protein